MSEWSMRRFWTQATVRPVDGGFAVELDGRPVRTPGKARLAVPTVAMAEAIAAEWDAQEKTVDPRTMPWTRSANSAIDKLSIQRPEVETHLIGYAGTDLLCYRAVTPEALAARQAEAWDPVLEWLSERFDVRLAVTRGVMPIDQDPVVLERLKRAMTPMSDFAMTGFHDLVTLTGSFTLGLAIAEKSLDADGAWTLSRIDEDWQIDEWGEDEEAADAARLKRDALLHAERFFHSA